MLSKKIKNRVLQKLYKPARQKTIVSKILSDETIKSIDAIEEILEEKINLKRIMK